MINYRNIIHLKLNLQQKTLKMSVFFFLPDNYIFKKCSQKCSHQVDFRCDILKFKISKIALNQCFTSLLTCNETLFNLFKDYVFTQFFRVFFKFQFVWSVAFVLLSKVQTFTRFFVFKCNIYAHDSPFL